MKNTRLLILPLISLFLLLISFIFLSYWGYRIFNTSKTEKKERVASKDSTASNVTRDSLRNIYSATLNSIQNPVDLPMQTTDSGIGEKIKPEDFYRLRNEITELLKNPGSSADLETARLKIIELQQKIQDLNDRYNNIEEQNKKLSATLNQVLKNKAASQNPKSISIERHPETKNNAGGGVSITDLNLTAINVNDNREVETTLAEQTGKFIGYFTIKHSPNITANEIYVVVTQPDGHVIQSSPWEAGSFETALGRKSYSSKLLLDGNRNESERLQFSLTGDGFVPGTYNVQVYHDGVVVKKSSKVLF
jgi:hypothetical protein